MQLQQLKAEELEQNKLNGVSTNTFHCLYTKRRVEGKKFLHAVRSRANQSE